MRILLPLALACLAAPLAAQTLVSVEPSRVVQVDPSVISSRRVFRVAGTGITPGASVGETLARVRLEMRRAGGAWTTVPINEGMTSNAFGYGVYSKDWLTTPGDLELRAVVDGRPTNTLAIRVAPAPTVAPEIVSVSPATLTPGTEARQVGIRVRNLSEPFTVSIGGAVTDRFGRYDVDAGDLVWYVPAEMIGRPGRYAVVVSTRAGASYPVYVDVLGVPRVTSVTPGEIVKERAGDASSVRLRVEFDGSLPTSARVGNDVLGWVSHTTLAMADGPRAVWVDVPMEMIRKVTLGPPQEVRVELANSAGASSGTLSVRSDGSAVRIMRPSGVTRPPPPVARPPVIMRPLPTPPRP
ncbi:MAG TPA: hypothetical protein VEX86_04150 [Longimicrobium sp.]|nr:hypothetical protein [Longimicrobium sp.]